MNKNKFPLQSKETTADESLWSDLASLYNNDGFDISVGLVQPSSEEVARIGAYYRNLDEEAGYLYPDPEI